MNKNTQIVSEESQIQVSQVNINKNQRKSKFNKFFSTVSAVMIASSIALSPMTLRADETDKKEIKTVQDANEKLVDGMKEIKKKAEKMLDETREEIKEKEAKLKELDKKIEQNNKEIEESKKREMEAKKQEMEADKELNKIKEKCNIYLDWLIKVKKHCSEKECSDELKNKIVKSEKEYNKECSELMASTSK